MFRKIRQLELENQMLREELAYVRGERDEAMTKAVELMHTLTYYSEQVNHSGLRLVKAEPPADGPSPEMFKSK